MFGAFLTVLGGVLLTFSAGTKITSTFLNTVVTEPFTLTEQTRVVNTIYQPNVNRGTLVMVTFAFDSPVLNDTAYVNIQVQSTSPPTNIQQRCGFANGEDRNNYMTATFYVPAGHHYRFDDIIAATGSLTIEHVFELTL